MAGGGGVEEALPAGHPGAGGQCPPPTRGTVVEADTLAYFLARKLPFVQTLTNGLEWLKRSSLHNIFVSFLSYVNMQRIGHSLILRDR